MGLRGFLRRYLQSTLLILIICLASQFSALSQCSYENPTSTLGVGLLHLNSGTENDFVLNLYNDEKLTDPFCSWNLYEDSESPFCAKYHKPDYGLVELVVVNILPGAYQILVNEGDLKYAPRTSAFVYLSWESYFKQSFGVRRKEKSSPLRQQPDVSAKVVSLPNETHELLCVLAVEGDWMQVKYDCFYNREENPQEGKACSYYMDQCGQSATGWLKWREGNQITMDVFTMP